MTTVIEPSIVAPDGRTLVDLTRDELLEIIKAQQAGIRLQFPGKYVARHLARKVRPRTSRTIAKYSVGSPEDQARNLVVEGDNLQTMVSLYRYRGQVDLILTDPPYNTGLDWRYNDRWDTDPNDPGLGDWVGVEDAGRHNKWMKFMYPRLQMMRSMLKPTGVLAICIDHRELFRLGQILDELFGESNRLAIINWERSSTLRNDKTGISTATEYILVYAKDRTKARTNLLDRTAEHDASYRNPDGDPDGLWDGVTPFAPGRTTHPGMYYAIQSPFTGELHYPSGNQHWKDEKKTVKRVLEQWGSAYVEKDLGDTYAKGLILKGAKNPLILGEEETDPAVDVARERASAIQDSALNPKDSQILPYIFFTKGGNGRPRKKTYLQKLKKGVIASTYWADDDYADPLDIGCTSWESAESGTSEVGSRELRAILGDDHGFETVKPVKLFQKIAQLWCPPEGLVLDPFAGSGTTGHALLAQNQATGSSRRFILIEQGRPEKGDSYARSLLSERLRRVLSGSWANGKGLPMPGGFRFVQLQKKVDADAVLRMERDEMLDTVIASHYDSTRRRGPGLVSLSHQDYDYLVAKNADDEGFFLIWGGPNKNINFTEEVYEAIAEEAQSAGLKAPYHVYARLYVFQTENVRFYQIPDRILADFGLNLSSEPFSEDLA